MISVNELAKKLLSLKNVALFCHVRPDGDALGSACALKRALVLSGVKTEIFCEDVMPERFSFLIENGEVKNVCGGVSGFDAFIAVDCADASRLGAFADVFTSHKNTFNIDHHVSNTRYARENYVVEKPANAINVYHVIRAMGVNIDEKTANLLALGLTTDTGGFRHKNVSPEAFEIAGILCGLGADFNAISYNMFTLQSKERAKLFGTVMSKIRYELGGRLAFITVTLEDLAKTGAKPDETEGFIDFIMGISGVEVGVSLLETSKDNFKVSFRSCGTDVNGVASTFGGGGHTLASGCRINLPYEETVDRVTFAVGRYIKD